MGADVFMLLIVIAVILSPFLPIVLKSKCPVCDKRKLEHLETQKSDEDTDGKFVTYYHCHNCGSDFQRERSGPLKQIEFIEELSDDLPLAETDSPSLVKNAVSHSTV